ncbi:MAG: LuxR family transcriptional regulator [Novosphingobium sp.]|nr:LuxR family transcriptional regulator [Novosphingobium sp.]
MDVTDFIELASSASTKAALFAKTSLFLERRGFDRLVYVWARPKGISVFSTFSESWLSRYTEQNYDRCDPFFRYCCATTATIRTGADYLPDYDYLLPAERRVIEEAGEAGARAGFSVIGSTNATRMPGGFNLCSTMGRKQVEKITAEQGDTLRLVSLYAFEKMKMLPGSESARPKNLTRREKECLLWAASGLRNAAIADKLRISEATVEFHMQNAREKLSARTRDQAVAIALSNGLIAL